jgi:dTDP-4-amino-4,6-dideoxygalactose transaminase
VSDRIRLASIDCGEPDLTEEILVLVGDLARAGAFVGGPEIIAFEEEFATYCGTQHAVGVSSGTAALALALRALGVEPGDEVIVPANTFVATAEAVTLVGATPRFVDVDPETALITAEHVAPAIGPRTRCVIPVHLYGRTVDLEPILEVADRAGLTVIEDACQAHGAWADGRRAGSVGHAGCFSFYPAKNLGAWGDAGAVVTDDDQVADRIRLLRSHGERPRYHHQIPGTTARLDALQAAVLRVKLRRLEDWNAARRGHAARLTERLAGSAVGVPAPARPGGDHVFHQYVVTSSERDALRRHLAGLGIETAVHYPMPIHLSRAYANASHPGGSLPVSERLAEQSCSLPVHPGLSADELDEVATAVGSFSGVRAASA